MADANASASSSGNPLSNLFGGATRNRLARDQDKQKQSTLDFLQVSEVRDNVLVLREGQMRSVLTISSANFALKSVKEQDIIISTFQGVLNSLEFPIQILVQSRKIDLTNYIDRLKSKEDLQENDLLKIKMQEYIEYIQQMIRQINIMSKEFYIVIGYEPIKLKEDIYGRFLRNMNPAKYIKMEEDEFKKNRHILMSRADQIAAKFKQLDLKIEMLRTDQLIALMYNSYNPDTLESIRIDDIENMDIEM